MNIASTSVLAIAFLIVGCKAPATNSNTGVADTHHPKTAVYNGSVGDVPRTGLDVYFVRHGETVSNFTGHYNSAGELAFSARGLKGIQVATDRLHKVHLDVAIVSPAWRTLATAKPILLDHRLIATEWPELYECCNQIGKAKSLPPRKKILYGQVLKPAPEFSAVVKVDPEDSRLIAPGNYQDGIVQTQLCYQKFIKQFSGKSESVLIVGHALEGSRFIELLLGLPAKGRIGLNNTCVVHLHQNPDGRFVVVSAFGSSLKPTSSKAAKT